MDRQGDFMILNWSIFLVDLFLLPYLLVQATSGLILNNKYWDNEGLCNQDIIVIMSNVIEHLLCSLCISIHLTFTKLFEVGMTIVPTLLIGKLGAMDHCD